MQPRSQDRDWTSIPVKGRVADKLIVEGGMDSLPDLKIVIGFQNPYPSVIERAIPGANARPARRQKALMHAGDAIEHSRQAQRAIGPPPDFALNTRPESGSAIDIRN